MSTQMTICGTGGGTGDCGRWWARLLAALLVAAFGAASMLVGVPQAWAGSHGVGYETSSGFFTGAYNAYRLLLDPGIHRHALDAPPRAGTAPGPNWCNARKFGQPSFCAPKGAV